MTRLDAMRQLLGLSVSTETIKGPTQTYGRDAAKLALPPKPVRTVKVKKVKTRTNVEPFQKRA